MPNFEVFDARIASVLNKIIHNVEFNRKVILEEQKAQKQDRFLRGRQIAYLIYEQFPVTVTHDSVENYTDLFTIVLRSCIGTRGRKLPRNQSTCLLQRKVEDQSKTQI